MMSSGLSGISGLSGVFGTVAYLLRDLFTTDRAAGAVNGTGAEPGPGTRAVVDATGVVSISGGLLTVNGTPGAISNVSYPSFARVAGRALILRLPTRTNMGGGGGVRWGLGANATDLNITIGVDTGATALGARIKDGTLVIDTLSFAAGEHQYAFVMRGTGGFLFQRVGASGQWTLLWVYATGTATPLFPKLYLTAANAYNFTSDDWRVFDLGGVFATDNGLAALDLPTPSIQAGLTFPTDFILDFTFTMNAGVAPSFKFRITDANNYWFFRITDSGTSGSGRIDQVTGGVTTNRSIHNAGYAYGTTYRVMVIVSGNTYQVIRNNAVSGTPAVYTDAGNQGISSTGAEIVAVGGSMSNLLVWPRFVAIPGT